jgi:hypothetical protein
MGDVALWLFDHGVVVGWVSVALALLVAVPLSLLLTLSRGYLFGAKLIAAGWVWRQAWLWWRQAWLWWRHRGGAGGAGGHSALYEATMRSAGWRRTRARTIRRQGRRCAWCRTRGPLEVHHLHYQTLGRERPEDVVALCKSCHLRAHAR